nr:hypothetical protein [Sedimentibacter sp.]
MISMLLIDMDGERGKDFIEGYHTKLVSELSDGDMTRVEDIAMPLL